MANKLVFLLFSIVVSLLTSCARKNIPFPSMDDSPTIAITVETSTPSYGTPTLTSQPRLGTSTPTAQNDYYTATEAACESKLFQITDGSQAVRELWWAEDNTRLYFWLGENSEEIWEYRVDQGEVALASGISRPDDTEIPGSLAALIPNDAIGVTISPQGDKVIYGVNVYTRPTPTPQSIGETLEGYEFILDIFVVSQDYTEPRFIGRIDGGLDHFTWFPDETHVMVSLSHVLPGIIKLWLADIETASIEPFYEGMAVLVSISPDNKWVAYYENTKKEFIARYVPSGKEYALPIRPRGLNLWWLPNGDNFLFDHQLFGRFDPDSSIYLYDMETGSMYPVTNIVIRESGWSLSRLSPNHTMFAYVDADTYGLHLITLCTDEMIE